MFDQQPEESTRLADPNGPVDTLPPFVPTIDVEDVFRRLIEDELRQGRLTRARRKKIIQYAVQLRMSAVQTGRLIEKCRTRALESNDPEVRHYAFRLTEPAPSRVSPALKISLVIALAILFDLLLLKWFV